MRKFEPTAATKISVMVAQVLPTPAAIDKIFIKPPGVIHKPQGYAPSGGLEPFLGSSSVQRTQKTGLVGV
jgi:hypothetical protein